MKSELFQDAICDIDDDLIRAADAAMPKKSLPVFKTVCAVAAACIALVCAAVIAVPMFRHAGPITPPIDGTTGANINEALLGCIDFDSFDDFIDTLKSGKLDEEQRIIAESAFRKDEEGNILICDPSAIKVPVCPDGFELRKVCWKGEFYSAVLESQEGITAYYHFLNEEQFNKKADYQSFFDNERITLKNTVEENGKTSYYYSTISGDFKNIRYTVTDGDRILIIDESYNLKITDDRIAMAVSDVVPFELDIYGKTSDSYFSFIIFGLKEPIAEEWVKCFGVREYEKENA